MRGKSRLNGRECSRRSSPWGTQRNAHPEAIRISFVSYSIVGKTLGNFKNTIKEGIKCVEKEI